MSDETKTGTQTPDSSSDTIKWRARQEPEMETEGIEASVEKLILKSLDERVKQGSDPIFRRVEQLCALISGRNEMVPFRAQE